MHGVICYGVAFEVLGLGSEALVEFASKSGFAVVGFEREPSELAFHFEAQDGLVSLRQGDEGLAAGRPLELALELMRARIHHIVSASFPSLTFVRGNTVIGEGRKGFLVAGHSLTGKSRLSQAIGALGAKPWSKHFAVLNDSGEVLPYPSVMKPEETIKVDGILLAPYSPGGAWEVRQASPGEMALNLVPLVEAPEEGLGAALGRIASLTTQAKERWLGERGEATEAAPKILELSGFRPMFSGT